MKTFDEEGIEKLGDLAGDDLANVLESFQGVKRQKRHTPTMAGSEKAQAEASSSS